MMANSVEQDLGGDEPSIHESAALPPATPVIGHGSILDYPPLSGHVPVPVQDDFECEPTMEQFHASGNSFTWENGKTHREFEHGEIKIITSLETLGAPDDGRRSIVDRIKVRGYRYTLARKLVFYEMLPLTQEVAWREVQNLKRLRHVPHIPAIVGTYDQVGKLGILMYPAAACDLSTYIEGIQKLNNNQPSDQCSKLRNLPNTGILLKSFTCLPQALTFIHNQNIRHKDITPRNVLIDRHDEILLTDFGLAEYFPEGEQSVTQAEQRRTEKYCAPEVLSKDKKDKPSDVFSLGCVLLENAAVIFGESLGQFDILGQFEEYRAKTHPRKDDAFGKTVPRTIQWMQELREKALQIKTLQGGPLRLLNAVPDLLGMLEEKPVDRPAARQLRDMFKGIAPGVCTTCDPGARVTQVDQVIEEIGDKDRDHNESVPINIEQSQRQILPPNTSLVTASPRSELAQPSPRRRSSTNIDASRMTRVEIQLKENRIIAYNNQDSTLYIDKPNNIIHGKTN